jgi:hypothetical protein
MRASLHRSKGDPKEFHKVRPSAVRAVAARSDRNQQDGRNAQTCRRESEIDH